MFCFRSKQNSPNNYTTPPKQTLHIEKKTYSHSLRQHTTHIKHQRYIYDKISIKAYDNIILFVNLTTHEKFSFIYDFKLANINFRSHLYNIYRETPYNLLEFNLLYNKLNTDIKLFNLLLEHTVILYDTLNNNYHITYLNDNTNNIQYSKDKEIRLYLDNILILSLAYFYCIYLSDTSFIISIEDLIYDDVIRSNKIYNRNSSYVDLSKEELDKERQIQLSLHNMLYFKIASSDDAVFKYFRKNIMNIFM